MNAEQAAPKPATPGIDAWWAQHGGGAPDLTWGSNGPYSAALAELDTFYGPNPNPPTGDDLAAWEPLPPREEFDAYRAWESASTGDAPPAEPVVVAPVAAPAEPAPESVSEPVAEPIAVSLTVSQHAKTRTMLGLLFSEGLSLAGRAIVDDLKLMLGHIDR